MKKIILTLLILVSTGLIFAQKEKLDFNHWSIDVNGGLNKTIRNVSPSYSAALFNFGELNFGVRYMFNTYAGVDLKLGFDRFQDGKKSPDFATNFGRVQLQGVVNLGNLLNFYQWSDKLGLLTHLGVGRANFVESGFANPLGKADRVGTMSFGLTPQLKLGNKWSINLDASIICLARINHTWNYARFTSGDNKNSDFGFNANYYTGTVGVSYYIGKKENHADWSPTKSLSKSEMDAIKSEIALLRKDMNDDDKDGVPNYLDLEPNSPEGVKVNSRGLVDPTITDTDNDGIADAYDSCPEQKGEYSANGCPDSDKDGVADKDDKCPEVKGSIWNEGCPGGDSEKIIKPNPALEVLYFSFASTELRSQENTKLYRIAELMNTNPSYKLIIKGHTDNMGSFDSNQILSHNRGVAAKNYLLKKGIDPMRIQVVAYGINQPASIEDSEQGRAKNRRVEFEVRN